MKNIKSLILGIFGFALLLGSVHAAPLRAGVLLRYCEEAQQVNAGNPAYSSMLEVGQCLGFTEAVSQLILMELELLPNSSKYRQCFHQAVKGFNAQQMVDIFVQFMKEHPERESFSALPAVQASIFNLPAVNKCAANFKK